MDASNPSPTGDPASDPTARLAAGALAALAERGRRVTATERLHGGTITRTLRLTLDDGSTVVLKQRRSVPTEAWSAEVDGLTHLAVPGGPVVPAVLAVGDGFLLLEDVGHPVPETDAFWEEVGRRLATLHTVTHDRFGWHRDNMLGAVAQRNPWTDDGWDFFARHRLLRYLEVDHCAAAFTPAERADLERVAGRLRDIVPAQPASLTHGDLWRSNVIAAGPTEPALCDPAISYCWAEVDLSMLWCSGGVPEACFAAYREVRPVEPGWETRWPLLQVREHLSVLAHVGPDEGTVAQIRAALAPYV